MRIRFAGLAASALGGLALLAPTAPLFAADHSASASHEGANTMQHDTTNASINDGRHDFDFWMGKWTIHNRRLKERLKNSHDWEEFEASGAAQPLLGGIGNIDSFLAPAWRPGFAGGTLRLFNPATRKWSIYWMENQTGVLQPPVVGSFVNGVGTFEAPDEHDGIPVTVRFTWNAIDPAHPVWQQAFSTDGGKSWETNWIMTMTRMNGATQ